MTDKPRTRRLALTLVNGQPRLCDEETGELIEGVSELEIETTPAGVTRIVARINIIHNNWHND